MKHRRRVAAILAAVAFALACDRSDLVSPLPDVAPSFSSSGSEFLLPVPEPAGYQPWIDAGTLKAKKWSVVRVQGKVDIA